jgi:hypothetical protein
MKKFLYLISSLFVAAIIGQIFVVSAAAYPPGLGGTGTTASPSSGQILIGNGVGTYTPALITPGTDIIITNASGSVALSVKTSDFLPSSTLYVASVNGQSGTLTITSSTLGVATNTLSLYNGNGFTTTTIASVLQSLSATNPITYNSSTGAIGWTNSNGYVTLASLTATSPLSYNNSTGQFSCPSCVTLIPTSTLTINGITTSTFIFLAGGTGLTVASSGNSITYTWTNPGYITTSTNNFGGLTNASVTANSPITWSTTSTISCPTCIATNTGNWQGTFQNKNASDFLASSTNLAPSTTIPTAYVSTFNGATGTVTYAPSTTIPTSYVSAFNGVTGTVTGVGSLNSATGTLTITAANTATVSTTVSTSGGTITVSSTIPQSIATTASPTFAGATINGNVTSTSVTATSTTNSQIAVLNTSIYIPSQSWLNIYGCPGFPSTSLLDTCVNDWYQNNSSTASSTNFYLSQGRYTFSDPTGFNFNISNERASIYCVPGQGTQINDTSATGTLGIIQWGTGTAAGAIVSGCSFYGANTTNTNASTSGNIGWLVNSPYITFRDDWWSQGSIQVYLNTNTYLDKLEDDYFSFAGYAELYAPNSGNSGESNSITSVVFATLGNATTTHCIYLNTQSTNITGGSIDGCTLEVGGLAHVAKNGGHIETVNANSTYGAYYPVQVDAGGVFTESNGDYQNDGVGASTTPAFINNSGQVKETNPALWANPSSTPNFIVGNGSSSVINPDITNSPGTNPAPTSTFSASCGTASGIIQGNQMWGSVTFTTSSLNCTITYPKPFIVRPVCVTTNATSSANIIRSEIITTSTFLFADTSNFPTSSVEDFFCGGVPN